MNDTLDQGSDWMFELEAHRGMLAAYARHRIAGTGWDPEDFVQDAMERVLRAFTSRAPPHHKGAWLVRALHNLLVTELRKHNVRRHAESDPALRMQLFVSPDEPGAGTRSKVLEALEELGDEVFMETVQSLRPTLGQAYKLHASGLGNKQIASALGISTNAAATRLHRARRQLRVLLSETARQH